MRISGRVWHIINKFTNVNVQNFFSEINECADGTDGCMNGATCVNTPGSYTCTCMLGYTGNMCEIGTYCLSII